MVISYRNDSISSITAVTTIIVCAMQHATEQYGVASEPKLKQEKPCFLGR
jgi:hypothetical protein